MFEFLNWSGDPCFMQMNNDIIIHEIICNELIPSYRIYWRLRNLNNLFMTIAHKS